MQLSLGLIEMWAQNHRGFCQNKEISYQGAQHAFLSCVKLTNSVTGEIRGWNSEDPAGHHEAVLTPDTTGAGGGAWSCNHIGSWRSCQV